MQRRQFIALLGGAATWPPVARAQQNERVRRIGVHTGTTADDPDGKARFAAFEQALGQVGWTPGRNVRIDYRFSGGDAATSRKQAELFDRNTTSGDAHRAGRIRDCPRSSRLRLRR